MEKYVWPERDIDPEQKARQLAYGRAVAARRKRSRRPNPMMRAKCQLVTGSGVEAPSAEAVEASRRRFSGSGIMASLGGLMMAAMRRKKKR